MAGIQFRKDASGDIHVNLDSSPPCWNDATEGLQSVAQALLSTKRNRRLRMKFFIKPKRSFYEV
jgi:hypothetical protein